MLIKINVDQNEYEKINETVNLKGYTTIHEFIKIAITNQLESEADQPQETENVQIKNVENYTDKSVKIMTLKGRRVGDILKLKNIPSDITWQKHEIMSDFYTRLFPVKVIVRKLARMIIDSPQKSINLQDAQEACLKFAQDIKINLQTYESENKLKRNKKLSTCFPPLERSRMIKGTTKKRVKRKKLESGKLRFMEQLVGKYTSYSKSDIKDKFSGMCFDFQLINVHVDNKKDSCRISLSELGKRFALIENPILDKGDMSKGIFADREISFIFEQIINKQFPLESKIIKQIIQTMADKEKMRGQKRVSYKEIEDIIRTFSSDIMKTSNLILAKKGLSNSSEKEKMTVTKLRAAIMGRLSELKIVQWELDRQGQSQYSLIKENLRLMK